jgi:hypothetical protein
MFSTICTLGRRRSVPLLAAVLVWTGLGVGWADDASLARYFPDGAVGSVEVSGLTALIERIENSPLPQLIEKSDGFQKWANSGDGKKARGAQAVAEGQLGMPLWAAVKRIAGDRMFLAVYPPSEGREQPNGALLVRLADEEIGPLLQEKLKPFVQLASDQLQAEDRDGAWRLKSRDGKFHAAYRGRWIALASTAEKLDAVLNSVANPETFNRTSLATAAAWQGLKTKFQANDTAVTVCGDLEHVRELVHQERLLPAKVDNALGSLLIGGLMECTALASRAQGSLVVGDSEFSVSLQVDQSAKELDEAHRTLFAPRLTSRRELTPNVPRRLGSVELSRLWADWYRYKDELHEDKILPEFDKFETGLATFLPGKDFAEDVLGQVGQPFTVVAARQTFPHLEGHPGVQLPAFGVVLELKDAQKGADLFNVFFQTVASISNIEAGKYGRQPWVLGSESHRDLQISYARYLEKPKGTELPIVYNFQPASALVGNHYIATTSLELCRDLIDAYKTAPPTTESSPSAVDVNFEFNLDPDVAAEMLLANRAALEAIGLQAGKSAEQVKMEIQDGQDFLHRLTPWQLRTIVHKDAVELRLTGGWK